MKNNLSRRPPAMGTAYINTRLYLMGMILMLFMIPILVDSPSAPKPPKGNPDENLEFTDVRIVKFDLPVPYSDADTVRPVILHSDSKIQSLWCQWDTPNALPCSNSLWDKNQEKLPEPRSTLKGIPSL